MRLDRVHKCLDYGLSQEIRQRDVGWPHVIQTPKSLTEPTLKPRTNALTERQQNHQVKSIVVSYSNP